MSLPPPADDSTALVTGASSGIGADIARELVARGHGVTLVARREDRLEELAAELSESSEVRVETAAADVADADARKRLVKEIEGRNLTVEVLINNAGFGSSGAFQELDVDGEVQMVRTNVEAVVDFCGVYAPRMAARGRGAILNVASTVAFQPFPWQATYGATKAFVLSFTEALHQDLRATGVTATALCPGPVETEFAETAGMGTFEQLPSFVLVASRDVARTGVNALDKGRRVAIPGLANQAGAIGGHFTPRTVLLPLIHRLHPARR